MATFTGTDDDEVITPETVSATGTASDGATPSTLADVIYAGGGSDIIYAGGGSDIVAGGGGNDIVNLGAGDDLFIWNPGEGSDTVDGGTGVDTLEVVGSAASELVEISASGGDARLFRNIGSLTLSFRDVEHIDYATRDGQDAVTVNDLTGTSVRRVSLDLSASAGGTAGDGKIDAVTVGGSATGDTILIEGDSSLITVGGLPAEVTIGIGPDGIGRGGHAEGDLLIGIESLTGSAFADSLTGDAGDNRLDGGGGDRMAGGAGGDVYVVDDAGDAVIEEADGGLDRVQSSISYALPANVEIRQGPPRRRNGEGQFPFRRGARPRSRRPHLRLQAMARTRSRLTVIPSATSVRGSSGRRRSSWGRRLPTKATGSFTTNRRASSSSTATARAVPGRSSSPSSPISPTSPAAIS
jgi:Ca2+-binding RTX toxin-like protein